MLADMSGKSNRSARFRTVIVLIMKGNKYMFDGTVNGQITETERGVQGFGYDSIFMPSGYTQTFAELSLEQKNKISHRANAVKKLVHFLTSNSI